MTHESPADPDRDVPPQIGAYRILDVLGAGGMGVVYLAEQQVPVRRRVALKVIKLGMDSKLVVARFEQERQALALMDHEGIAKVFDCGTTERGQPYFVMELVKGEPLDAFCEQQRLSLPDRLQLMQQVCAAVQHAHQKGVVHRDLKPGNVLITDDHGRRQVKVIDFGLAKAMGARLVEATLFTEAGQIVGTPEYMAPEQADPTNLDIDTRADIWSLGVMLYQLLVGELPFPAAELRRAGMLEIQRILREVDPPKPSTRLSSRGDASTSLAHNRRLGSAALHKALRNDLDWVVLKALDKERNRRYQTASALAADLQRFLDHEPLVAGPPSAGYRLRKLARRYRSQVAALAAVFLVLLLGVVGTTIGFARARESEQRAEKRASQLEQVARFQEQQLREIDVQQMGADLRATLLSEARAGMARSGVPPADVDERLAQMSAHLADTNFTNVALANFDQHVFERARRAIDEQFADQPLVAARLLQAMATTMHDLGLYAQMMPLQERALAIRERELGEDDPDTLQSIAEKGRLLQDRGDLQQARDWFRRAWEGRSRVLGPDHEDTLTSLNNLAHVHMWLDQWDRAEDLLRQALAGCQRTLGSRHELTLTVQSNLGTVLHERGALEDAERAVRENLELTRAVRGEDHQNTLTQLANLGVLLCDMGNMDEGLRLLEDAVARSRGVLGDGHPQTLRALNNLFSVLIEMGREEEAGRLVREAVDACRRHLRPDHPMTLQAVARLAQWLEQAGDRAGAEPLRREVLAGSLRVYPEEHRQVVDARRLLAVLLQNGREYGQAATHQREVLATRRRRLGDEARQTQQSVQELGYVLYLGNELEAAEPLLVENRETCLRAFGPDDPMTLTAIGRLGMLRYRQRRHAEAERLFREHIDGCRRRYGEDHLETISAIGNHATTLGELGRHAEAVPQQRLVVADHRRRFGDGDVDTLIALYNLATALADSGELREAERCHREALAGRRELLAPDHPHLRSSIDALADVLVKLGDTAQAEGRFADAAQHHGEAHALRVELHGAEDARAREVAERLVAVYEAWHAAEPGGEHAAGAAFWREKLR